MPSKASDVREITVRTQAEVAEFFGVSRRTVEGWRTRDDPMPGKPGRYPLAEIVRWLKAGPWRHVNGHTPVGPEDPDMVGPTSPELERYRRLRGDMVALQLAEKRSQLINPENIRTSLNRGCNVIRTGLERLQREHGREAFELMEEVMNDFERAMIDALPQTDAPPNTGHRSNGR